MGNTYGAVFDALGLRAWCDQHEAAEAGGLSDLLSKLNSGRSDGAATALPFPSLDVLHQGCSQIPQTRDATAAIEDAFLWARGGLRAVLDPLTQPLSWLLDGALSTVQVIPWWLLIPLFLIGVWKASRSIMIVAFVAASFFVLGLFGYLLEAMQTLAIVIVCTLISVVVGLPIGVAMAKCDRFQRPMIPFLDILQTLPTFVYLIPLIFLFSVTESKLYGIAIIAYAIVPVVRLTDLGIRLVDQDVVEAANAFGMTSLQRLFRVELPLAVPNIMAGINQTIMMSLAMVVIASLVSAPGLGVLVLRGIRNLELGVGILSGFGIVLLAVILDRTSKAALARSDSWRQRK